MTLDPNMTEQQFKKLMQVLAVKHHQREKPIREAVRFARQHPNPAFYRIAINKIDGQKLFHHEMHGPSRWQKLVDYLSGTPKDAAITLLMVVAVLGGLSAVRSYLKDQSSEAMSDVEVDRLAKRMGLYIAKQASAGSPADRAISIDHSISKRIGEEIELAEIDQALAGKFSDVIDRSGLGQMATQKLTEELNGDELRDTVTGQIERILEQPAVQARLVDHLAKRIDSVLSDRVNAEVKRAVTDAGIDQEVGRRIDSQIHRLDEQIAKRTSTVAAEVEAAIKRGIEQANLDHLITKHIEQYLSRLTAAQAQTPTAEADQSSNSVEAPSEESESQREVADDDLVGQVANVNQPLERVNRSQE